MAGFFVSIRMDHSADGHVLRSLTVSDVDEMLAQRKNLAERFLGRPGRLLLGRP